MSDALSNALEELARDCPLILLDRFDEAVALAEARIRAMSPDRRRRDRRAVAEVAKGQVDDVARLIESVPEAERHAVERAFLSELTLLAVTFGDEVRRRWPRPCDGRP